MSEVVIRNQKNAYFVVNEEMATQIKSATKPFTFNARVPGVVCKNEETVAAYVRVTHWPKTFEGGPELDHFEVATELTVDEGERLKAWL